MDSVFFNVNPTLKQLTDNVERSSDLYSKRATREKDDKKKTSVDRAEVSPDSTLLGDDMMGSMDPDMFRRGRRPFFQRPDEEEEEEEHPPLAAHGGEHEGEGFAAFGGFTGLGVARHWLDAGSVAAVPSSASDGHRGGVPASGMEEIPVEAPAVPAALDGRGATGAATGAGDDGPGASRLDDPASEDLDDGAARSLREELERRDLVSIGTVEDRRSSLALELEPRAEPPVGADSVVGEPRSTGEGLGLMDWGDGFLLADAPAVGDLTDDADEAVLAAEAEAAEHVPSGVEQSLDTLLRVSQGAPGAAAVRARLKRFGARALGLCVEAGVCVALEGAPLERLLGEDGMRHLRGPCRQAGYLLDARTVWLSSASLADALPFDAVLLYFAHALDHALGGDEMSSLQSAAVLSAYKACQERLPRHQFIDGYCAQSPARYFAGCLEAYLTSETDDPRAASRVCTRERLYDLDRSMYLYLEYLLRRTNGGPS